MKPKTVKIIYWVLLVLFVVFALFDGIAGIVHEKNGVEIVVNQLGYPLYALTIIGIGKVIGGLALLQNKYRILKEWAFAGFTINFVGAFLSHVMHGDGANVFISPIIFLIVLGILYYFWKRYEGVKNMPAATTN